jgi:alpha-galactosidase
MKPGQSVYIRLDTAEKSWCIGNKQIECQVHLVDEGLVWTILYQEDTGRAATGPSTVSVLEIDSRPFPWIGDVDAAEAKQPDGSRVLQVTLRTQSGAVQLSYYFQVFPNQPFVRLWGTVENSGSDPFTITASQILNMAIATPEPLTLFHVEQFSWVHRRDFFNQHQVRLIPGCAAAEIRMGAFPSRYWAPTSCAWAALRTGQPDKPGETSFTGTGVVIGIEFNGKSRLRASATADGAHLTSSIDDLNHSFGPGEIFEVPACFIGLFEGDWDQAGYVTQRFAEAHIHPPMPDEAYPWVQYNTWGYDQDIHEAQQLEAVERCAQMGVEVVVLDLGWAVQIGEWHPHPVKFPRGLSLIADRAHQLGLKFGVHLPLAQANVSSPVAQQNPDWLIHTGDDYFGAAPICLGHRPCRDWLIGEIIRMIDEYHLDYIVHDGEDMVKKCHKQTHTHTPGNSNYANSTEGLDIVIETVRQARPQVIWENCEDGGCMLTYKMARLCHSTITVDNIATYATRQGVYGASYPFSPRYSVRYMQDDPTPYTLRSAIFGGPLILMQQVTEWNDEQIAQTKAAIAQYKALRGLVRDAKIIHLLPPQYNVEGIGWGWDAIQAVSSDQMRSVVMVYRALGDTAKKVVRPRGLRPDATYRVYLTDRGDTFSQTGAALAQEGVELELDELSSEVIHLDLLE